MDSLTALLSRDSDADLERPVEAVVAAALSDAGVWSSPRASDGVQSLRVVEWGPRRVRVCGKIWNVDQTLHTFWLDVEDRAAPTWTLYFDVDEASMPARRARHVLALIQEPVEVDWLVTLTVSTRR